MAKGPGKRCRTSAEGLGRKSGKMLRTPRFPFQNEPRLWSDDATESGAGLNKDRASANGRRKETLVGIIATTEARSNSWKKNASTVACITIVHGTRRWTSIVAPSNINNWPCPSAGFRPSLGSLDIFMDRGTVPTRSPYLLVPSFPLSLFPCLPACQPARLPTCLPACLLDCLLHCLPTASFFFLKTSASLNINAILSLHIPLHPHGCIPIRTARQNPSRFRTCRPRFLRYSNALIYYSPFPKKFREISRGTRCRFSFSFSLSSYGNPAYQVVKKIFDVGLDFPKDSISRALTRRKIGSS